MKIECTKLQRIRNLWDLSFGSWKRVSTIENLQLGLKNWGDFGYVSKEVGQDLELEKDDCKINGFLVLHLEDFEGNQKKPMKL